MPTKVVFITSGTTFTVPSDFSSLVSIEAIGGGGGTAGYRYGAGGSAYSKITTLSGLTANQTLYVNIGAGGDTSIGANGGDSWLNKTTNASPTSTADGLMAQGGKNSSTISVGAGGTAIASVGSTKFNGGGGANGTNTGGGGGGGAAGPVSAGGAGGGGSTNVGGGGGAGGATSGLSYPGTAGTASTSGGPGGYNPISGTAAGATSSSAAGAGANGGGGGGGYGGNGFNSGGAGGAGTIWVQTSNSATAGPGGGAGGSAGPLGSTPSVNGSLYGGGAGGAPNGSTAGVGGQGIIVFTYNTAAPAPASQGNFFMVF